ncbi:MAG: ribonuclease J [Actinomycetota bacterium]|nr:ribonuclease J [Actinomycetota bacterium]
MAAPVTITFLGGLGEVGRNCAAVEIDGRILVVDCGLMFPGPDLPGIDQVLPDLRWLAERADRVEAVICTHGHEDHIGALRHLLVDVEVPIYGSAFTLALVRSRLEEAGVLKRTSLVPVEDGDRRRIGPFDVEFIPMTHSIPSGFAIMLHTPQGPIMHTGDFKIDLEPVDGRLSDLARVGAVAGERGVRLLLADSTNADVAGFAASESSVGRSLYDIVHEHEGRRLVVACFASHIHRVQQIADAAIEHGRYIATLGLSMKRNVRIARELGLLKLPSNRLIDIAQIGDHEPGEICIVSTGSQAEPRSALTLMAQSDNRWVKIGPEDTVVLSSHPIPGNEADVDRVIDGLVRLGAEVVHSGHVHVHASGHGRQGDLRILHSVARPEWFVPVHGEVRHLTAHKRLAEGMGMDPDRILMCEDGGQVVLGDDGLTHGEQFAPREVYVDGIVGDVGPGVLRDRRTLGDDGFVCPIITVDLERRVLVSGPKLATKGWVWEPESAELLAEAEAEIRSHVLDALADHDVELPVIERRLRRATGRFVADRTRRRPIIVPTVLTV